MPLSSFAKRVLAAVRRIPPGRVATYGDIAGLAGSPRAHRAVGSILRECRDSGTPCHRVIGAGGALGGFGSSLSLKRELLRAEGHDVGPRRIRGFDRARWPNRDDARPPAKVRARRSLRTGRTRRPS